MNLLLDANVAYVVLMTGFVLGVLALFAPGTGFLEFSALAAMILAGYSMLRLPINPWALAVLFLGAVPFLLALRRSRQWPLLLLTLLFLIVGSIFVFRGEDGAPAIHPIVATTASIVALVILWIVGRKGFEVMHQTPDHDLDRLLGMTGESRTVIQRSGSVYINGENWSARSEISIPVGSIVRVVGRQGLILLVEPVQPGKDH